MSIHEGRSRSWVEIDLSNLLANARAILRAAPRARLLPMVKANAYGLGVLPVARALEAVDPWGYGVATVEEGRALREAGIRRPIVVFTPASADQLPAYAGLDLRPVLDAADAMAAWDGPYHLEIDTGMGRAGIPWWERDRIADAFRRRPEGVFTHFHSADVSLESVRVQQERFRGVLAGVPRPPLVHAANSPASFRVADEYDLVRPGIYLYGGRAGRDLPPPRPVAQLRATVVSLRRLRAGDTVSYGATWTAHRDTVVATLGVGYADGIRRSVQGRAEVLVGGRRYPVVGRVTMDMTMIDAGARDGDVALGAVATVLGTDGGSEISLDEFADWAGTISYEILTGLGGRVSREYVGP